MFEKERFVEECHAALKERDTYAAVRGLVARAVREPTQIVRVLGEPRQPRTFPLHAPRTSS